MELGGRLRAESQRSESYSENCTSRPSGRQPTLLGFSRDATRVIPNLDHLPLSRGPPFDDRLIIGTLYVGRLPTDRLDEDEIGS